MTLQVLIAPGETGPSDPWTIGPDERVTLALFTNAGGKIPEDARCEISLFTGAETAATPFEILSGASKRERVCQIAGPATIIGNIRVPGVIGSDFGLMLDDGQGGE